MVMLNTVTAVVPLPLNFMPLSIPRRTPASHALSLPPLASESSSPPRSSSPPMTPSRESASARYTVGVRSSPGLGLEIGREVEDDDRFWRFRESYHTTNLSSSVKGTTQTSLPGIKALFADELNTHTHTQPSKHHTAYQHGCAMYDRTAPSPPTSSCAYTYTPPVFMDSEDETQEEEEDDDDDESEGISFVGIDIDARATFFRVSAERGRWRYDPPSLLSHALHHRQSQPAPTVSPPPIVGLKRPISEPLPSTSTLTLPPPQEDSSHAEERSEVVPEGSSSSLNAVSSSDLEVFGSDRDSSDGDVDVDMGVDVDGGRLSLREDEAEKAYSYSPLPPSSPLLLSSSPAPVRRSISISPLSFAPHSSPRLPPSSPLSFLDSLPPEEEGDSESESGEREGEGEKDGDGDGTVLDEKSTLVASHDGDVCIHTDDDDEKLILPASLDVGVQLDSVNVQQEEETCMVDTEEDSPPSLVTGSSESCVGTAANAQLEQETIGTRMQTQTQDPEEASIVSPSQQPALLSGPSELCVRGLGFPPLSDSEDALSPYAPTTCIRMEEEKKDTTTPLLSVSMPCGDEDGDVGDIAAVAKELFGDEMGDDGKGAVGASGGSLSCSVRKGKMKSRLKDKDKDKEALRTKDENGVVDVGLSDGSMVKREKRKEKEGEDEARKKVKVEVLGSTSVSGVEKKKTKRQAKRRLDEEENKPAMKYKKQKRVEEDGSSQKRSARPEASSSTSTSKHKTSSSGSSKAHPPQEAKSKFELSPLKDPETEALHAEIRGMLIESMALSRASCLPASSLYRSAMECRPSLGSQRNEKEWMEIIQTVLWEGEASRGGSGVFGKVESSFKDESGRPLEAQWFYVPEMDEDQERAALIRSMMPRPAKRNETKKYKQYYYRPLGKITRWDREDDL